MTEKEKMKSNKEIELDVGVDPYRLDDECVAQPQLYFRYAAKLADARHDLERVKAEMELVDAELDLSIRGNPENYGLTKVTEASLRAVVLAHKQHTETHDTMLGAKHVVDVLAVAVAALDHKKKSIELLVQLQLANYFSRPKVPEKSRERVDEVEKRSIRRKGRRG